MPRNRKPPSTPEQIAERAKERRAKEEAAERAGRKDCSTWGVTCDTSLQAHRDTEIRRDPKGRATAAWRSSVINALHRAGALTQGHVNAAEDLAAEWAAWKKAEGKPEMVGKAEGFGPRDLVTDRMVLNGRKVADKLSAVGPLSRRLLKAFMAAMVEEDRPMSWRGIVERETGETREKEQRTMAVFAFEELRLVSEGRAAA